MELDIVELSRLQFAMTAMHHFLFVPLTLGLSIIIAIMETVYVITGRPIWRQLTKFWGTLFGVNFVLGVAAGITMEFQFGMNWSSYSHYVGDIFGAPLAIEGLMAFFLETTFVHAVSAGYLTVAICVLGVSAWYLLKNRHVELARRSITVAASFGLAAALSVVVLGDEPGYFASHTQRMELAAIEAMWETHDAPAPFTAIGYPDQELRETHSAGKIPWAMGLIGTRSLTHEFPGINDLVAEAEVRVERGIIAYDALQTIREQREATPAEVRATFEEHSDDLGFAYLLLRDVDDPRIATPEQIAQAAEDTVPTVAPMFWAFRIMVGLGFALSGVMACFFFRASFKGQTYPRWALWAAVFAIPTPWIAAELRWFVAEFGRLPWTVDGVLPTTLSTSHFSVADLSITLAGFMLFYLILFVVEMGLGLKNIRIGWFRDVGEPKAWDARHEHRLRIYDGKGPFAPAGARAASALDTNATPAE